MDILTILESAAAEIRSLRERAASDKMMRDSQTLRIAISQMRGNHIDYKDTDDAEWNALSGLIEAGRIAMDHAGEAILDKKVLTKELLRAAMAQSEAAQAQDVLS